MKDNFPYQPPMGSETIIRKIKSDKIFGMVQCDIHVPENLKQKFEDFPPIFKNVAVSRDDIGDHMRNVAEENNLFRRPQRMTSLEV